MMDRPVRNRNNANLNFNMNGRIKRLMRGTLAERLSKLNFQKRQKNWCFETILVTELPLVVKIEEKIANIITRFVD